MARKLNKKTDSTASPHEVFIYGVIGKSWWDDDGITDSSIAKALAMIPDGEPIALRINSPGGDISHGLAIYNQVRSRQNVTAYIDGYAASAASFIALAADTIISPESSIWMIHNAHTIAYGDAASLRHEAEALDVHTKAVMGIYTERTGQSEEQIRQWLDGETWFTGTEALGMGFATATTAEPLTVEQVLPEQFKSFAQSKESQEKIVAMGWRFGAVAMARQGQVNAIADLKQTETSKDLQIMPEAIEGNHNDRLTQMSDEIRDLKLQLGASQKVANEATATIGNLNTANQYWQLRSSAINLFAVENKLTEEEYGLDFSDDPAVDIERLTSMGADDSRIELKTIDRALRRSAMKQPIERLEENDRAKLSNSTIKSQKVDAVGDRATSATQEFGASPTGESAVDYAANLVNRMFK